MVSTLSLSLEMVLVGIWGYTFYQIFHLSKEAYGTTVTSSLPYFLGGYGLFFFMMLLDPIQEHLILGKIPTQTFLFSLQVIQIIAGIMLVKGMVQLYNLTYATEPMREQGGTDGS